MQTIADIQRQRYERLPIKERILRQLVLNIKSKEWEFKTVNWDRISRDPLPDSVKLSTGSRLTIIDGVDEYSRSNTQAGENTVEIAFEFTVDIAKEETASTVLNIVQAEIVEILSGDHQLVEEGTGEPLSLSLYATQFQPDYDAVADKQQPRGLLMFDLRYRFRKNKPFDPHR